MLEQTLTSNFDFFITKVEAFIMHQSWKSGENVSNIFQDVVLTTFGTLRQTHRLTNSQKT